LPVLARFVAGANAACDPTLTYPAVGTALKSALAKAGLTVRGHGPVRDPGGLCVQMLADAKTHGHQARGLTTAR
jgi:hypothetical protein